MKTLVIVDAQIDFMPGGALEVKDGDRIIPVINQILPQFELVVATQDWHPKEHKSFAVNHSGKNEFEVIDLNGMEQKLWPVHCVQGTKGADLHPNLETKPIEAIFRKGMDPEIDSYSGFFDNGHRKITGLAGYLKERGAVELYFCGLAADICVYYSLLDALKAGFNAALIEDAAVPLLLEGFDKIREDIIRNGGRITQSKEL